LLLLQSIHSVSQAILVISTNLKHSVRRVLVTVPLLIIDRTLRLSFSSPESSLPYRPVNEYGTCFHGHYDAGLVRPRQRHWTQEWIPLICLRQAYNILQRPS